MDTREKWYKKSRVLAFIVFMFAFLIYSNTLDHGFAGDDPILLSKNGYVQKGIHGIKDIFTSTLTQGYTGVRDTGYRPVPLAMFAMEKELFGGSAPAHHWIQVLLYALGCVLTFFFLKRILHSFGIWPVIVTILLFTVHPIHTEVVANIKSRDEIMGFIGGIGALFCLLKYTDTHQLKYLILSIVSFTVALFSKESALTIAGLIPLTLYYFTPLRPKRILLLTLLFLPSIVLFFVVRTLVVGNAQMDLTVTINSLMAAQSLPQRIATSLMILSKYLGLLLIPYPLSMDYSYNQIPCVGFWHWKVWIAVFFITAAVYVIFRTVRKKEPLGYGFLFWGITFSMTCNVFLLIGTTMAERLLFMPSLGFCLVLAMLLFYLKTKWPLYAPKVIHVYLCIIILVYAYLTYGRNPDWKSNPILISKTLKTAPNSTRIQELVGSLYYDLAAEEKSENKRAEYISQSINHLKRSIDIYEQNPLAHYLLGFSYKLGEQYDQAIQAFSRSCQLDSTVYRAWLNLGISYSRVQHYVDALESYQHALRLNPNDVLLLYNIGFAYRKSGDFYHAVHYFENALEKNPEDAEVLSQLVKIYRDDLHDMDKALYYNGMIKRKN
jgi:hypothetical protein